jgi:succinylglutamic semialdehyde dehydrogenase
MNPFRSTDPITGETVWSGHAAGPEEVTAAVLTARAAFPAWARRPAEERETVVRAYARALEARRAELALAISRETGKPQWEALTEVQSMVGKAALSLEAQARRCGSFAGGPAVTRFRPHGVVAVLGPYNLPNGHIVPALLAGNVVVFKPSEHAPLVAELMAACWRDAGLPEGVLAVAQGGRETGAALALHRGIDGLFFTGSSGTGLWLAEQFARTPGRILALEMGGNNPLLVWDAPADESTALLVVQSAFLTAGQRCTCARRLIVPTGEAGDELLAALAAFLPRVRAGHYSARPEPFMGPVISAAQAERLLTAQRELLVRGAKAIVPLHAVGKGVPLLAPGLIDVSAVRDRADEELFGPLLQVVRVPTFAAALAEANATRYGLAAGLIGGDAAAYERFRIAVRVGVVNWNQPLTGASGAAPFGGVGLSGNHRPSAYFAADYCSYPVASIERDRIAAPSVAPEGIDGFSPAGSR